MRLKVAPIGMLNVDLTIDEEGTERFSVPVPLTSSCEVSFRRDNFRKKILEIRTQSPLNLFEGGGSDEKHQLLLAKLDSILFGKIGQDNISDQNVGLASGPYDTFCQEKCTVSTTHWDHIGTRFEWSQ